MVKHFMDELNLLNLFKKYVPATSGCLTDHAESLCVLTRRSLSMRTRIRWSLWRIFISIPYGRGWSKTRAISGGAAIECIWGCKPFRGFARSLSLAGFQKTEPGHVGSSMDSLRRDLPRATAMSSTERQVRTAVSLATTNSWTGFSGREILGPFPPLGSRILKPYSPWRGGY